MKILQYILYGVIIGRWLLAVKGRLCAGKVEDRYAVVGMHSSKDEFIFVGRSTDKSRALDATNHIEDNSMSYIGICYDLLDPDDRAEFEAKLYCSYVDEDDLIVVGEAREML